MSIVQSRRKRPVWYRVWHSFHPQTRDWSVSITWAFAVIIFSIAVLAVLKLTFPEVTRLNLSVSIVANDSPEEALIITDFEEELELEEPEFEAPPELIPVELPALQPEPISEMSLDHPVVPPALDALPAQNAAMQPPGGPSSLSDLHSDAARAAETNRRVKARGGELNGPVRISLSYSGKDDIDLHVFYDGIEKGIRGRRRRRNRRPRRSNFLFARPDFATSGISPGKLHDHVSYRQRRTAYAQLDVDANAHHIHRFPCENIVFQSIPWQAKYTVILDFYRLRSRYAPKPYVLVVKYGEVEKVLNGHLSPKDRMRTVFKFSHKRT